MELPRKYKILEYICNQNKKVTYSELREIFPEMTNSLKAYIHRLKLDRKIKVENHGKSTFFYAEGKTRINNLREIKMIKEGRKKEIPHIIPIIYQTLKAIEGYGIPMLMRDIMELTGFSYLQVRCAVRKLKRCGYIEIKKEYPTYLNRRCGKAFSLIEPRDKEKIKYRLKRWEDKYGIQVEQTGNQVADKD